MKTPSLLTLFLQEEHDTDFDLKEAVDQRAGDVGWPRLLDEAFTILRHDTQKHRWRSAVTVLYWAVGQHQPLAMSVEECAARLYRCLERFPGLGGTGLDDGENLVWSLISALKGISYASDWDPYQDPKVVALLAQLRESEEP